MFEPGGEASACGKANGIGGGNGRRARGHTRQGGRFARLRIIAVLAMLGILVTACSEAARPTPGSIGTPTAPATPADYAGVPDAATFGAIARPSVGRPGQAATSATKGNNGAGPTPTPGPTAEAEPDPEEGVSGPGDRVIIEADPTALARLYGSPGPGPRPGGGLAATSGPRSNVQPRRPAPTPTLSTNPQAVRIETLRLTPVSFLAAYKQASLKLLEVTRTGRLVFASANVLKADRAVWTFMFLAPEISRMWRIIYDTEGNRLDLREIAPSMADDLARIDMSKVLDSPALIERAGLNGLNLTLPVDIVNFQVEGLSKQPCFIFTNVAQGKQVALHAYTGQIIRNDFNS